MQVITIEEDNHGLIGIAKTYADAVFFLVKENWLDENCELYDGDGNYKTVSEDLGEEWFVVILEWSMSKFNEYFEGCFYLNTETIFEAE